MANDPHSLDRYARQTNFEALGLAGQRKLLGSTALIVGLGGLGSWIAELLARSGVGRLRLVDDDRLELMNIHRQGLYDEVAGMAGVHKVEAAAARLAQLNHQVRVEPIPQRLDAQNIEQLAHGVDLVIDGTDNFATRFIINDWCVLTDRPWIFGGVVQAQGQVMTIPGSIGPCLRCVFEQPPQPSAELRATTAGVLPPAVAVVAALQACEALKILSGRSERVSPYLLRLDLWTNQVQRIDVARSSRHGHCPCCRGRRFEFLYPPAH